MALATSLRNVGDVNGRAGNRYRLDAVDPVAIGTGCRHRIAFCVAFAVNAGQVLAQLIGSKFRVVRIDELRIGMTGPAEGRNFKPIR